VATSSVEVNLKFASDVAALQATIQQLQALKTAAVDTGAGAQAAGAGFQELQARLSWLSGMVQQMSAVGNAAQTLAARGGALGQAYQSVATAAANVNTYLTTNGAALVKAAQGANLDAAAVASLNVQLTQLGRGAATSLNALGPAASGVLGKLQAQQAEFGKIATSSNQAGSGVRNLGFAYGTLAARLGAAGPQMAASVTGFQGMGGAISDVTVLMRVLASQMAATPALALAMATAMGAIVAVIGGLVVGITGLTVAGVKLNAELENTQTALAATLNSLAGSTYGGQAGALKASADAMDQLQQKSNALQVPLKQTLEVFDGLSAAATLSGASLDKQNTLYTQLVAAQSRLHVSGSQLISDVKNLINGRVSDNNQVALALDLSKEQILAARENGTIVDLLNQKTRAFAQSYQGSSNNFDDATKKMQAALQQLELVMAKPIMQPLIQGITNVATALGSSQMQSAAASFGQWLSDAATKSVEALQAVLTAINNIENACLQMQRVVAGAIDNALIAARDFGNSAIGKIVTPGLGAIAQGGVNDRMSQYAQQLAEQEDLVRQSAKSASAGMDQLAGSSTKVAADLSKAPPVQAPPGGYPKAGGGGHDKTDQQDAQEMAVITAQLTAAQNTYNAALEKAKLDHQAGLTGLQQEQAAEASAGQAYIASLNQIKGSLEDEKSKIEGVAATHGTATLQEQKQLEQLDAKIQKVNLDIEKTGIALQQTSFQGQFISQLQKEFDQLSYSGTKAAEDIQSVWTTAFGSINKGITELISGSKSFGQVMSQVGTSILNSLVQIAAKMLENYVLQEAMQLLGITTSSGAIATAVATGAGIQAAYSGAAMAASIASYGAAAVAGETAYAAAMAAAQIGGGLAEGGIVPGHPSHKDNVLVPMARGEGVVKAASVQHYGASVIHSLNARTFPKHGYAAGGIVGGGSFMSGAGGPGGGASPGRALHVNVFTSKEELAQHTLNHPDAEHKIVDTVRRNRFSLKI
jgi:lambda family phage tail tape measure protein